MNEIIQIATALGDTFGRGAMDLVDRLGAWTLEVMNETGYLGLCLVMVLENVFPPIPSELVLPLAGSLTLSGPVSGAGVIAHLLARRAAEKKAGVEHIPSLDIHEEEIR